MRRRGSSAAVAEARKQRSRAVRMAWSIPACYESRMLNRVLAPYTEHAYALLRIVAGVLFAFHGMQKLFGVLGGKTVELVSQRGLGGIIELAGGLLIALGLFTRPAAFLASGTMAVA